MISIMSYSEDFILPKKEIIEKFTENSKNINSMNIVVEDTIINKNNNNLIIYKEASLILMELTVKMPSFDIYVYAKDGYIYTAESFDFN